MSDRVLGLDNGRHCERVRPMRDPEPAVDRLLLLDLATGRANGHTGMVKDRRGGTLASDPQLTRPLGLFNALAVQEVCWSPPNGSPSPGQCGRTFTFTLNLNRCFGIFPVEQHFTLELFLRAQPANPLAGPPDNARATVAWFKPG